MAYGILLGFVIFFAGWGIVFVISLVYSAPAAIDAEWQAKLVHSETTWRSLTEQSQTNHQATIADCQRKIQDLKDKLAGPDNARMEHVRELLGRVGDQAKQLLRIAALRGVFDPRQIEIKGAFPDGAANMNAARECEKVGLLTMEWTQTDPMGNQHLRCEVPPDLRDPLARILHSR